MKEVAVYLAALGCAWLWMCVLAPTIARAFGVPMAVEFWRLDRKNRHLSKSQYVWGFGVFSFGLGMSILFNLWDFLSWRFLGDQWSRPSLRRVAASFVVVVISGVVYSLTWRPAERG